MSVFAEDLLLGHQQRRLLRALRRNHGGLSRHALGHDRLVRQSRSLARRGLVVLSATGSATITARGRSVAVYFGY